MAMILSISCLVLMTASIFTAQRVYDLPSGTSYQGIQRDNVPTIPALPPLPKPPEVNELVRTKQNNDFAYRAIIFSILVIVFGTGITYIISGRALKPVTDLSKKIEEIDSLTVI